MYHAAVSTTHTFYVDESGHAGVNYLDHAQPFHVAGGFLVPNGTNDQLIKLVSPLKGQAPELKASRLTKSESEQKRAAEALRSIFATGTMPFYWAMERSFCIAGKLVDVFLDPEYYPQCAWLPTWDFEGRADVANQLVTTLPAGLLDAFGQAYQQPSYAEWEAVLDNVAAALDDKDARLAATFRAAKTSLTQILDAEDMRGDHGALAALNVPALMQVLRLVDRFVDFKRGRFRIVHDKNVQFESKFRQMVASMSVGREQPKELRTPDGRVHRQYLGNVESIEFLDSKDTPELQAADLLVSTVTRVAKDIPTPPARWPLALHDLATAVLPPILDEEPAFAGMYASIDTKTRLLIALLPASAVSPVSSA